MQTYLLDKQFLTELSASTNKTIYARIIVQDMNNYPIETLEGQITNGSINIDGKSSLRRSCSINLTIADNNILITDDYWKYNHQFSLEIGLANTVNNIYAPIIWFKQGIYIISNFTITKNTNSRTVSIQGKDKMCRLNGEISGSLPMTVDFGTIETVTDNVITVNKVPIKTIIFQAIREYGQEPPENIIIKDIDDYGYELWDYRGDTPLFMIARANGDLTTPEIINSSLSLNSKVQKVYKNISDKSGTLVTGVTYGNFEEKGYQYYSLNTLDTNYNINATLFDYKGEKSYLIKVEYGETAGYHAIPLTYPSDLIFAEGAPLTNMLDALVKMLGEFEYFYDCNGRFVFQKKRAYNQKNKPIINNHLPRYDYEFNDFTLISAFNPSPKVNNIKNDFTVWGSKKTVTGQELPIHVRYAIAKKPVEYNSLNYYQNGQLIEAGRYYSSTQYDWRELIYRMAIDFYRNNENPDFFAELEKANPLFINGKTGYEPYYADIQGFWRQLYNPSPTKEEQKEWEFYGEAGSDGKGADKYWTKRIHTDPNTLNFWFDFIDTESEITNYSINNIGMRSKVVNDTNIKTIYNKDTPEALFVIKDMEMAPEKHPYNIINITSDKQELFYRSTQGLGAIDKVEELINIHLTDMDTVTLTSIPIFYLQPNAQIKIMDYGDFAINSISFNLSHNGTMQLNCTKIVDYIY